MKIVLIALIGILNILFFKDIATFLINQNFSWTFSKILPYVLLVIIGVLAGFVFKKQFKAAGRLKLVLQLVFTITPFMIGFAFNPIYEGDFSKQGVTNFSKPNSNDIKGVDFVVLTIPGCPFCHESTSFSNLMQKRNPNLKIRYIVCSLDSNQIEPYRRNLSSKIEVVIAAKSDIAAKTAGGSFPAFLLIKNNKAIQKWSNDQFGVRAKDMVEAATN